MHTVTTVLDVQAVINTWRLAGEKIAFVPTMGNLHAGHLQLVSIAKTKADRVVVSIFVNPTQFGAGEDFETYPRTENEDQEKLQLTGADLLFLPSVAEMYTDNAQTIVSVGDICSMYCGSSRPGHFNGVATIVCKLFNIIQPAIAVFGLKDFQQLLVIRTMVIDLHFAIQIIGVDTVREASGLAMSSRNNYLSASEKTIAPLLYQSLKAAHTAIIREKQSYPTIQQQALRFLQQAGFEPDYFSICRSDDLKPATPKDSALVILAAARLGKTRLIDNICFLKEPQMNPV